MQVLKDHNMIRNIQLRGVYSGIIGECCVVYPNAHRVLMMESCNKELGGAVRESHDQILAYLLQVSVYVSMYIG